MKAVICLEVPEWQIGEEVSVYFPDTMIKRGKCESQEPLPPVIHENSYGWKFYYCPNCKKEFYQNRKQNYCDKCGQPVKWEGGTP